MVVASRLSLNDAVSQTCVYVYVFSPLALVDTPAVAPASFVLVVYSWARMGTILTDSTKEKSNPFSCVGARRGILVSQRFRNHVRTVEGSFPSRQPAPTNLFLMQLHLVPL